MTFRLTGRVGGGSSLLERKETPGSERGGQRQKIQKNIDNGNTKKMSRWEGGLKRKKADKRKLIKREKNGKAVIKSRVKK